MTDQQKNTHPPLAVVGVSALFPGSTSTSGFWSDILAGTDLLTDVPASHWLVEDYYDPDPSAPDKTYANRGGFLEEVDFDAMGWGIPPNIIPATDTSQLLALIVAEQVLRDAARDQFDALDRSRISCILGVTSAQELLATMVSRLQRPVWVKSLREHGVGEDEVQAISDRIADHYQPWQESSFPGLLGNVVAGRIANRLDLGGTNCVTDAACASTFSAVQMAAHELYLGESDMVITGGVDTLNDIFMYMCFSKTPALSPTGDCRPFSDQADGTMLGEGLGMVALRRLDDAVADGNRIYAVLRGVGSGSDGRSKSVYAPVSEGQARALARSYEYAGYSPKTVELLEAHGTGTKAGDVAEFNGLRLVFEEETEERQWCAIGSVKSQIGHTKAAAGAAGLFKAVMGLHQKVLPPTLKVDRLNPKLDIEDSPFYVNTQSRPWVRSSDHPRRASVSAFGFGGSNFHLTLEEYVGAGRAERLRGLPFEFVSLSAEDGVSLASKAREFAARADGEATLQRLAWESHRDYLATNEARLGVVASTSQELAKKLTRVAAMIEKAPDKPFEMPDGTAYGVGTHEGDVAFVFPGQGSQYVNMGADLAMSFDEAIAPWDRAADMDFDGERLDRVVFPMPKFTEEDREADEQRLRSTEWAQPGIGVSSLSALAMMRSLGVSPAAVAGHSFGEVTALHAAGVFTEKDMLRVARKRGELMAEAAELPGAMTAVSATIDVVESVLEEVGDENVVIANHNAPDQVVISGTVEAVRAAEKAFEAREINIRSLAVSTAFHSPVVAESAKPFGEFLADIDFGEASIDVFAGETASVYDEDADERRATLARQIANPVRFVDTIEALYEKGVRTFIEVGPGSVLTKLVSGILDGRDFAAVSLDRRSKPGLEAFFRGLAGLVAAGLELDLESALWAGYGVPEDVEAKKKPKLAVAINGANYDKAYPPAGGAAALPAPNPAVVHAQPAAPAEPSEEELEQEIQRRVANELEQRVQQEVQRRLAEQPTPAQAAGPQGQMQQHHAPQPQQPVSNEWLSTWQEAQRQNAMSLMAFQHAMAQSQSSFMQAVKSSFETLGGQQATDSFQQAAFGSQQAAFGSQQSTNGAQSANGAQHAAFGFRQSTNGAQSANGSQHAAFGFQQSTNGAQSANGSQQVTNGIQQATGSSQHSPNGSQPGQSFQPPAPTQANGNTAPQSVRPQGENSSQTQTPPLRPQGGSASSEGKNAAQPRDGGTTHAMQPGVDLHALMLEAVAEKTGYPAEMLELEMDLEGDLGIDSIKRVEILAAVQEQAPGMPDVDTNVMASLKTLGEIVEYMQSLMPQATQSSNSGPIRPSGGTSSPEGKNAAQPRDGATTHAGQSGRTVDLHALMLEAVAEKTGYPADMLELDMDLEGDLGIDSIKRVEILAAVQEQAPGMPDVDTNVMSTLKTLGEIVEYMQSLMPQATQSSTSGPIRPSGGNSSPEGRNAAQPRDGGSPGAPKSSGNNETPAASAPSTHLGRFTLELVPTPASGLALPWLYENEVTVIGSDYAEALANELISRGINAVATDDVSDATSIIYLGGLADVATEDEAIAINREAFRIARTLANQLEDGGLFATVQDTGGKFGTTEFPTQRAYLSGLPGLVKTASQEWPAATLKAIDLERGERSAEELAKALADELLRGGGDLEVGLTADGERFCTRSVGVEVQPDGEPLTSDDVIVVSGGAKGVTASCMIEWASRTNAKFVLLGRSKLEEEPAACKGADTDAELKKVFLEEAKRAGEKVTPADLGKRAKKVLSSREIRATIEAIQNAGGEALYVSADVTDSAAIKAGLDEAREKWGPITSLVHGAGVLADKYINEMSDDDFDFVFDTKVEGLRALLAAIDEDLKAICLFSSVSARCGNNGQANYAMANEVLNKVAWAHAHGSDTIVKSLGWGPWEGGMVSPELKAHFQRLGVPMIPLDDGAKMFADEMQSTQTDQVELVLGGKPQPAALLGGQVRELSLEINVSSDTHAYLKGHSIEGTPVIPVVLVLEWFTRIAQTYRHDLYLSAVKELRMLKGIRLENFEGDGDRFVLTCKPVKNGSELTMEVQLHSADGTPHYSARVETSATRPNPAHVTVSPKQLEHWGDNKIYGDVLFHTDDFQVIVDVDGIGKDGISGEIMGVRGASWTWDSWQTDVAALDGGLQMVLLWARQALGGSALPVGIDEYWFSSKLPGDGNVHCIAECRTSSSSKATADVLFLDGAGERLAAMRGVELILRPGAPAAKRV